MTAARLSIRWRFFFVVFTQAHYACARESTVFELGLLPAEAVASQGNGNMTCSLGVSVNT